MKQDSDIQIKQLATNEIDQMRSLLNLFGEACEDKETYCNKQPTDTYLENLLNKDHFITLIATQAKKVVGGLTAYVLDKFEQQRSEIYVYDLAVDESFRRQGIATNLINHLKEIAKTRGAYVIIIQADWGDQGPINLYEKLGKKEKVLHFDISPTGKRVHP
jgi:aminoglycoside 3-N-acetyltransferase I